MNKGFFSIFLWVFLLGSSAFAVVAQQSKPSPDELNSDTSQDDILILVNLTAKELKFDTVPTATVEFPGTRHRSTIWVTQRQNLPDKVEPGVTYRNIGIQLRISSRFADIERIVKEALGEIPVTDEPITSSAAPRSPDSAPALIAQVQSRSATPRARTKRRTSRK